MDANELHDELLGAARALPLNAIETLGVLEDAGAHVRSIIDALPPSPAKDAALRRLSEAIYWVSSAIINEAADAG